MEPAWEKVQGLKFQLLQKANKLSSFVVLHGCSVAVLYTLKEHYVYGARMGKDM